MTVLWFRLFGVAVLAIAGLSALLVYSNTPVRNSGGLDLTPLLIYVYAGVPIGIGLLLLRKWAALLFALALLLGGGWIFVRAILDVPWPGTLLYGVIAFTIIIPALITFACWNSLTWRGRWWI